MVSRKNLNTLLLTALRNLHRTQDNWASLFRIDYELLISYIRTDYRPLTSGELATCRYRLIGKLIEKAEITCDEDAYHLSVLSEIVEFYDSQVCSPSWGSINEL